MWSKRRQVAIDSRTIRNSTAIGTPIGTLTQNFKDVDTALSQIGAIPIKLNEIESRPLNDSTTTVRKSTYRAFGCIVENYAVVYPDFEHDVAILGDPEKVKRVEVEITARVPDWKINIPEDAESRAAGVRAVWIKELHWKFPEGFNLDGYNSWLDVAKENINNIGEKFGIPRIQRERW